VIGLRRNVSTRHCEQTLHIPVVIVAVLIQFELIEVDIVVEVDIENKLFVCAEVEVPLFFLHVVK
jgi:hypothetical protein